LFIATSVPARLDRAVEAPVRRLRRATGAGPLWLAHTDGVLVQHRRGKFLFLFDGYLYPDTGLQPHHLLDHLARRQPAEGLRAFKGRYAGLYVDLVTGAIRAFSDHAGDRDLFFWQRGSGIAVSDDFGALVRSLDLSRRDLDQRAVADFQIFGFAMGEQTFVRSIRRCPPGSLIEIDHGHVTLRSFWRFALAEPEAPFDADAAVEELDALFRQAARRSLAVFGARSRYCLGLSGGLDSRLVAHYFHAEGADLFGYSFGEPDADECQVAGTVADHFGIDHYRVGRNRELPRYFAASLKYQPMADLEWCKYLTGRSALPEFDALITGFVGNHLFGSISHALPTQEPAGDGELATMIYDYYFLATCDEAARDASEQRIESLLREIGGSTLSRCMAFWYRSVKWRNKHCGLFHDFGRHPHIPIFTDIDVMDFCLRLPPDWLHECRFQRYFFDRKLPALSVKHLRRDDQQNAHKPIESWLRDNREFADAALALLGPAEDQMLLRGRSLSLREMVGKIVAGHCSRNDIHRFFLRLTPLAFQHTYLT